MLHAVLLHQHQVAAGRREPGVAHGRGPLPDRLVVDAEAVNVCAVASAMATFLSPMWTVTFLLKLPIWPVAEVDAEELACPW